MRWATQVSTAGATDWRAAAWCLARRDPDNWGAKVNLAHTEEPDAFEELLADATDEELEILQNVAMRRRGRE